MRKLLVTILVLALGGSAIANVTYSETLELYSVRTSTASYSWYHDNPAEIQAPMTSTQYEQAVANGEVTNASLTIVLDNLDTNEGVNVWIQDKYNVWHNLGALQTMSVSGDGLTYWDGANAHDGHRTSTTFDIEPGWLNGLPVQTNLIFVDETLSTPFEIETSTLSVTVVDNITLTTPAPGAILLGSIGVGLVGWLRRRRTL